MLAHQNPESVASSDSLPLDQYKVIRRNGSVVPFEPVKISIAVTKAFIAVNGGQGAASARVRELVEQLTANVVNALVRRQPHGGTLHIEDIQDQVELSLMRSGEHDVARSYVLYREQRSRERSKGRKATEVAHVLNVKVGGNLRPLDVAELAGQIQAACAGLGSAVDAEQVLKLTLKDLYDGVAIEEVRKCSILAARTLIEHDPAYSFVTARLLLNNIFCEVLGEEVLQADMAARYVDYFPKYIKQGIAAELLNEELANFDLERLANALDASRDQQFNYLGLQTLYDRYFLHMDEKRIELPQAFFMRVAMGLSLNEINREERAIEFYRLLSSFDFMSSTPTLFNSGTRRS
ncbi:MAG: ATP cone domain-containing protein, partial [Gallionellaceae bacterium]|nr:ATP cone domain-containing protein [Gallionellaceae bacterium]